MMNTQELKKQQKRLHNTWPLIGGWWQRKASRALAQDSSAAAVPLLLEALNCEDADARETACAALRGLRKQSAIDALCRIATQEPDGAAARICVETNKRPATAEDACRFFQATGQEKALRYLKDPADIEALCKIALQDTNGLAAKICIEMGKRPAAPDEAVRFYAATWQKQALGTLSEPKDVQALFRLAESDPAGLAGQVCRETNKRPTDPTEACRFLIAIKHEQGLRAINARADVEALCRLAVVDPRGLAARICVETGKRPADPEDDSLFLFVTRQFDTYFKEDFEFQNLRAAYDRADEATRNRVMEIIRSGDRRFQGFFGVRKPLSECTDEEIRLFVDSGLRHKDWPRLFRAFLEMPLKYGFPLLNHFRTSGWEPEDAELQSVYQKSLQEGQGAVLPDTKPKATSSVFERWLNDKEKWKPRELTEARALEQLQSLTPPEAVSLVAAITASPMTKTNVTETVRTSPHWLIRLAGYATGLISLSLTPDEIKDSNYWVRELVGQNSVLEFWPVRAKPADLEALTAAPPEAFVGKLGAARQVLRLLIGHRLTTGSFEEMVIEAAEFAGEFAEVEKVE